MEIGGALSTFILIVQIGIVMPLYWYSKSNAQIQGELPTLIHIQMHLFGLNEILFRLSSITKKGEIESASRPLKDLVIENNLNKYLMFSLSIWAGFLGYKKRKRKGDPPNTFKFELGDKMWRNGDQMEIRIDFYISWV